MPRRMPKTPQTLKDAMAALERRVFHCKLTRLKVLKKERRDTGTFHIYSPR